jgi:CHAD domain-containing protein
MARKADESKTQFCRYGARYLSRVCSEFRAEMDGVREGRDPEAVHRMRVASRRLRAGLPVFSRCFPPKTYQKISRGIRRITRDLGDARDLDVQIRYLEGILSNHKGGDDQAMEGCLALLSGTRGRREALQPKVVADCARLDQKGVIALLEQRIGVWKKASRPSDTSLPGQFPIRRAQRAIERRIKKLTSYAPMVQDPGAMEAHHAMRIAAKRLRYLLEVYTSLYNKEFKPIVRRLKTLQEILGNIHDCDVWIMELQEALENGQGNAGGLDPVLEKGMAFVLIDRRRARNEYYLLLKEEWDIITASGLFRDLQGIARAGPRSQGTRSFTRQ